MKFRTLLSALLLFGAATLQAQDQDPQVSMRIDFVSWGEDIHGLEVLAGKRGRPVTALAFRYSEPFQYTGSQILSLALGEAYENAAKELAQAYEAQWLEDKAEGLDVPDEPFVPIAPPEVKDGEIPKALALAREKNPALAALVRLPAASRRVTVLLAPGPQRSLVPHIFDDDPSRHPEGTPRVHNLSPHPVSIRTAAGKTELPPGKSFMAKSADKIFAYEIAYQIDGVWKTQENNMINIGSKEQLHMVILRDTSSFFTSSDGSRGGFLQVAFLRRPTRE
jgi:hypothetical protein